MQENPYKIFISHKNDDKSNYEAQLICNYLKTMFTNSEIFLDIESMPKGRYWDDNIYENIEDSDVLIVIALPNVASNWVIREVAYARGLGISILPVFVDPDVESDAIKALQDLAIERVEGIKAYGKIKSELRYQEIQDAILGLAQKTRENQIKLIRKIQEQFKNKDSRTPAMQPAATQERYLTYRYEISPTNYHNCNIHITAGSITEVNNIQVIVNSENMYMQMQRVFAPESVSKRIRIDGSRHIGDDIHDDNIQRELNEKIRENYHKSPVPLESVIVTSAGWEGSKLRERGIEYIFHVAVVEANMRRELRVEDSNVVYNSVINCLKEVSRVSYDIKSIIFPVLASGNAGLEFVESATAILKAFKYFLKQNPNTQLSDIHLAGYTKGQLELLVNLFNSDNALRKI